MANVNATATEIAPLGGATNAGYKLGFIDSATKATQNDTVTVSNASNVLWAILRIDADGTDESVTISGNVITLTDATTGAVSGIVIYKS